MSLILLIETATTSCSVALAQDDQILYLKEINQRNIHAEVITLYIEECLNQANKQYNQLDAVAVSSGPGSYTGLRIGVSTVKGLCFSLDKPMIAVDTMTAMANGLRNRGGFAIPDNALLCPMIDARRMEVYTALFDAAGRMVQDTAALIIDDNSFSDILAKQPIVFFGDGAAKCREAFANKPNAIFADDFVNSAQDMLNPATSKYKMGEFVDVAYYEPFYLKDFIAGKKKESPAV
jgi:tRNA threonylcarbamoyladenosine biosynthesis protein TsaB